LRRNDITEEDYKNVPKYNNLNDYKNDPIIALLAADAGIEIRALHGPT
jgi:hypothetical protein